MRVLLNLGLACSSFEMLRGQTPPSRMETRREKALYLGAEAPASCRTERDCCGGPRGTRRAATVNVQFAGGFST
jgi:hypothetical protein